MSNRRSFIQRLGAAPLIGAVLPKSLAAAKSRDYFSELGVRTFINAAGTYTTLSASLMPREVIAAIDYASKNFVSVIELQDKVGERIAKILGTEAAMVTSGAAGAMTVGTAACITGTNQKAVRQLPDLTGLKSEVIIQKSHRFGYDHAVRACGVKLVEVETADELQRAANDKTAMMLFFNDGQAKGKITAEEFVALGKKLNVPTFNDCSADVPPVSNLTKYTKMGFDLVTFSGGKGIRGPQSAGILGGRADLIKAARMNTSPNSDTISRGMKVNKEEMLGMLVALELFVNKDHEAEWREWERRIKTIGDAAKQIKSVETETYVPPIANHVPHLKIRWDQSAVKITPREVKDQLQKGTPSIEANPATDDKDLVIGVWMLQPGEAEIVAKHVKKILQSV